MCDKDKWNLAITHEFLKLETLTVEMINYPLQILDTLKLSALWKKYVF